jgi:hypothetical protein
MVSLLWFRVEDARVDKLAVLEDIWGLHEVKVE